jgi:hypothetical protein
MKFALFIVLSLCQVMYAGDDRFGVTTPTMVPTPPTGPSIGTINPSIKLPPGYKLAWNQDFTAPAYSPFNQVRNISLAGPPGSIWHAVVGNPGGMKTQFNSEGDPFSTANGYLTIHANGTASPPYGGLMSSSAKSFNVPFGTPLAGFRAANAYWEAKLLIPAAGSERWPVFWIIGSTADAVGSQYGEVDIIEFPNASENLHTHPISDPAATPQVGGYTPPTLSAGWHIFGCLVQSSGGTSTATIWIDGTLSHQFMGLIGFSTPMEVVLDNSFGPGLPASGNAGWTNDLGCQYIRCWTPQ